MAEDDKKVTEAPAKSEEEGKEKKGRGRPKKPDSEKKTKPKNPGGKRGRPPKPESEKATKPAKKENKPRGRPKSADSGKPKTHPPVAEMVTTAVAALKDRKGCSLSAVKKYIAANYEVDMERQAIFIRRFVRKSIDEGKLVLVKGTSSTGSFKLADPSDAKKSSKVKSPGKRGRPKGSKGQKKTAKAEKAPKAKGTGKRGRPKGSKKKGKEWCSIQPFPAPWSIWGWI